MPPGRYLERQIRRHLALFFHPELRNTFDLVPLRWTSYREAILLRSPCLAIPVDRSADSVNAGPVRFSFNNTTITLPPRLPAPDDPDWKSVPEFEPLWYCHPSGACLTALDLFGGLFDHLALGEERESTVRDRHGRFVAAQSKRLQSGLLETPAFNDIVALLVAAAVGIHRAGQPDLSLPGLVGPPVIVLSHDCDILRGNDLWTQAVRAFRMVAPLSRFRPPELMNAWWILRNAITPERFYFDNIPGMIDLERQFGCHSTFYLLNGSGGRFGARSGSRILARMSDQIAPPWEIGMHYNYDTHLDAGRFRSQKLELEAICGRPLTAGRAHYLRFDPEKSFPFWQAEGIIVDESAGYPDRIGYRCGVGGCFRPFDPFRSDEHDIWEVPMIVMEATLLDQYGEDAVPAFDRLLDHLAAVGGALSLVVHPGMFVNPEFPRTRNFYHRLLMACRRHGAIAQTASQLAARAEAIVLP